MTPDERSVAQAALDVAIERLCTFHPASQIFIFGPEAEPFWSHFEPLQSELELLKLALTAIEQRETSPAPLVFQGPSGHFTAMVLDAERTLFAVIMIRKMPRSPAETRVGFRKAPAELRSWRA